MACFGAALFGTTFDKMKVQLEDNVFKILFPLP